MVKPIWIIIILKSICKQFLKPLLFHTVLCYLDRHKVTDLKEKMLLKLLIPNETLTRNYAGHIAKYVC